MSLKALVAAALDSMGKSANVGQQLDVAESGRRLTSQIVALDTLGCAFEHFTLVDDALSGAPIDRLKQISQNLSQRLNYLLEPISPIEVDAEGCTVQMRSNPPQKEEATTTYYELLVRRSGELSLRRYSKFAGVPRQVVPAQVTREVFLRLTGDFAAAV